MKSSLSIIAAVLIVLSFLGISDYEVEAQTHVSQLVLQGIDNDGTNWWVTGTYNGLWRLYKVASDRSTILASYYLPHSTDPWYIEYLQSVACRSGYVYVLIFPHGPIYKLDPSDGSFTTSPYSTRSWTIDIASHGSTIWQARDYYYGVYEVYSSAGDEFTMAEIPGRKYITSDGTYLYIGDVYDRKIYKVTTSGQVLDVYNTQANQPRSMSFLSSENAIYSHTTNSIVKIADLTPWAPKLSKDERTIALWKEAGKTTIALTAISLLMPAVGLPVAAITAGYTSYEAYKIYRDPPDNNYFEIYIPKIYPFPESFFNKIYPFELKEFSIKSFSKISDLYAMMVAWRITLERYHGAIQDGNIEAAQMQLNALEDYIVNTISISKSVEICLEELINYAAPYFDPITLSPNDIENVKINLSENGFGEIEQEIFNIFEISQEDISEILQSLLNVNTADVPTELISAFQLIIDGYDELNNLEIPQEINIHPIADAGLDQEVICFDATTFVTLDGSLSTDADSDPLTYTWTGSFSEGGGTVSGVNPTVSLPVGIHEIQLTVDDGKGGTDEDSVNITVFKKVFLDIKPQSCPNPLNVKSKGVLPVAILGSEYFDVTEIDVNSINLRGIEPTKWNIEDVSTPVYDEQDECECNNLGADGYDDLTLKFDTQELVETLGSVNDGDVVMLFLTAKLIDDTPIRGKDCIIIKAKTSKKVGKAVSLELPTEFSLSQNSPNPFNPVTAIEYVIPAGSLGNVTLKVYDIRGALVRTLVNEIGSPGVHSVVWDSSDETGSMVSSGVYIYRLQAGKFSKTNKMLLVR